MGITFTQIGNSSVCAINTYCSARSLSTYITDTRQAIFGGVAFTSTSDIILNANETNVINFMWECILPQTNIHWNAGNWTVNLDIYAPNSNITWVGLDICRISSGCVSQANIANRSLSINLGTTGVKSTTVTGVAQNPSAGDKVVVLLAFTNSDNLGAELFTINSDSIIVSPFTLYAFRNIPFRRKHR